MTEALAEDQADDWAPLQLDGERLRSLSDLRHPIAAYLAGLAQSSRRRLLAALEAIARGATSLCTAETMRWHQLRRHHVLRIRQLLEDHYQPATANGCWPWPA